MDSACYHHGGPLELGDIEDFEGNTVIKCPWHRYCITLSGEGLYHSVEFINRGSNQMDRLISLKSKGKLQRTHETRVWEGFVYVLDSFASQADVKEYGCDVYSVCKEVDET